MTELQGEGAADDMTERERALMAALRAVVAPPPAPEQLTARCEGLLTWVDVDAELAALLEPELEAAGTRGGSDAADVLEFAVAGGACRIEVALTGDVLDGQVSGLEVSDLLARSTTGATETGVVDDDGTFQVRRPPANPIRLEIRTASDDRRICTDWFVV